MKTKRILSVILTLALIMTLLPTVGVSAGAAEAASFNEGNAMNFDGADDILTTSCLTPQINNITMEAWVKVDGRHQVDDGLLTRIMYNGDSGRNGYGIYLYERSPCVLVGGVGFATIADVVLGSENWYHIAAVRNSGIWTIYVNGVGYPTYNAYAEPRAATPDTTFTIGNSYAPNENFYGSIDEVRLWCTARTPQELKENMFKKLTGNEGWLVACYNFDNNDSVIPGGNNTAIKTVENIAGDKFDLTISGFALNGSSSNFVQSATLGTLSLGSDTYRVNAGDDSVVIPIVRTGRGDCVLTINYATADGTAIAGRDYMPVSGSFTFSERETLKLITVPIIDSSGGGQKTFSFTISGLPGTPIGTRNSATVKIMRPTAAAAIQFDTDNIAVGHRVYLAGKPWHVMPSDSLCEAVVESAENTLPLLSDFTMGTLSFGAPYVPTTYYNSKVRGFMYDQYKYLSPAEKGVVASVTLLGQGMFLSDDIPGERFFAPSIDEVTFIGLDNPSLQALHIDTSEKNPWWLRTFYAPIISAYAVSQGTGHVTLAQSFIYEQLSARPACHMDLSSVLFISAAADGKSAIGMEDSLKAVPAIQPTRWKLTLLDNGTGSGRENFAVSTTSASATQGGDVSIEYSGAKVGTALAPEYLSAMVLSNNDDVLYYGRIKELAADGDGSGTQSITIPAGLAVGEYKLRLFNEQYNDNNKTDYSSAFVDVPLTVSAGEVLLPPPFTRDSAAFLKLGDTTTAGAVSATGSVATSEIDDITMEIWVNPGSDTAAKDFTFINGNGALSGYGIYVDGKKVSILMGGVGWVHSSTGGSYDAANRDVLTPGQWTHIAITRNAADGVGTQGWKIYINGRPMATAYEGAGGPAGPNAMNADSNVSILRTGANTEPLLLSEARIWEKALTQKEICENMGKSEAANADKLVGYWKFDDGMGTTLHDVQTNKTAVNLSFTDNVWVPSTVAVTKEDMRLTGQLAGGVPDTFEAEGSSVPVDDTVIYEVTQPEHGSVTVNAQGVYTYTPAANYNGGDSFTFMTSANGYTSAAQRVSITVTPVPDPPKVTTSAGISVLINSSDNVISYSNLEVSDVDSVAADITYTLTAAPTSGTLMLNETELAKDDTFTQADINNGKITYTRDDSGTDPDSFSFTACDEAGGEVSGSFPITVGDAVCTISFYTQPDENTIVAHGAVAGSLEAAAYVSPIDEKTTAASLPTEAVLKWYACDTGGKIFGNALQRGGTFTIPTGLAPGTHYYLCQATATGAAAVNTSVAAVTVLERAPTPAAAFSASGADTGILSNVTTGMKYSIDGGIMWIDVTGTSMSISNVRTENSVRVKQPGDGSTSLDSEVQVIPVSKAETPTLTAVQPTAIGGKGSIPMTTAHEYKLSTDTIWTSATGDTTLAEGAYHIRIKAAGTVLASDSQTIVIAADLPTEPPAPSTDSGSNRKPLATTAPVEVNVEVEVDGKVENIGTVETTTNTDGTKNTTVNIDGSQLETRLAEASPGAKVSVTIPDATGSASARLFVNNVDDMAKKEMTLSVQVDDVSYDMPAAAIDTKALMDQFHAAGSAADVAVDVSITELTDDDVTLENGELVLPPVQFTVTASYGGRNVEVEAFEKYVRRVIEIPAGVDASKITTAVVVENGKQRHVPTELFQKDGKWYARINSLTNSTYALINYEADFTDDDGKWFEAIVTEMASRGIINGKAEGIFDGEANITRAEFAAILVRALGLPVNGDASAFGDVAGSAWYYGAIGKAHEYGLINGRSDGIFDPQANITRQEAMALVYRAADITEFVGADGTLNSFSDADSISPWALEAAQWNVGNGLISGNSRGEICGQENITRGETAAIILRLLQKSGLVDVRAQEI